MARIGTHKKGSAGQRGILIVEAQPAFREGLVRTISAEADLRVCGQVDSLKKALRAVNRLKPDLVLADITSLGKSGLKFIEELRAVHSKVKLLVLSMRDEAQYAEKVLRAGADGYVIKETDPREMVHAIRDILGGHLYVSEEVMAEKPEGRQRHAKGSHTR